MRASFRNAPLTYCQRTSAFRTLKDANRSSIPPRVALSTTDGLLSPPMGCPYPYCFSCEMCRVNPFPGRYATDMFPMAGLNEIKGAKAGVANNCKSHEATIAGNW